MPPPLPEGLSKAFQSVAGGISCCPPDTEFQQKCARCPFSLPTCHGIPAKVFQVSHSCLPPATVFSQKCVRWHLPASHLLRFSRKSVPGVSFLPSTCHGFLAKVCQVASPCLPPATVFPQKRARCLIPAFHLPRFSRKSVSGGISLPPTCYSFPTKACQVACSTSHLTQNPGENVPGDTFLPSTWHDVHADVLAAGCNLNGEAPSFRPKPGRRKQGGEQAV